MSMPKRPGVIMQGDVVVTPIAGHYGIGRITADCETQTYLESQPDRLTALARACHLAGQHYRVFLAHPAQHPLVLIDCTDVARSAKASTR